MTKKEMEEYIPKNTCYCYTYLDNKRIVCPWYKYIDLIKLDKTNCEYSDTCDEECWSTPYTSCRRHIVRCEYLDYTDEREDSLLWDMCKECDIGEYDPEF